MIKESATSTRITFAITERCFITNHLPSYFSHNIENNAILLLCYIEKQLSYARIISRKRID